MSSMSGAWSKSTRPFAILENRLNTLSKLALALALAGATTTPLWAQDSLQAAPEAATGYTEVQTTAADMADEEFTQASSGASKTFPAQCSSLRKNGFVVIKGFACKIVDMSTSKTGKHGHAKVHLVGIDIFTGRKYEDLSPSTHNMDVPEVTRQEFQVVDITDDGFVSLMNSDGELKSDLKVPEGEVGEQLKTLFADGKDITATVLGALGIEQIVSCKEGAAK